MNTAGKRHICPKRYTEQDTSDEHSIVLNNTEDMIPIDSVLGSQPTTEKYFIEVGMGLKCMRNLGVAKSINSQVLKLNSVDHEENLYRRNTYKTIKTVLRKRIHCTICDGHIEYHYGQSFDHLQHPLLKVLCCLKCISEYNNRIFTFGPENQDQFCRWCSKPPNELSPLRHCMSCLFAFCEDCIYYNLSIDQQRFTEEWFCPVCNIKELWPSRGILWALKTHSSFNCSRAGELRQLRDMAQCCPRETIANVPSNLEPNKDKSSNIISVNAASN